MKTKYTLTLADTMAMAQAAQAEAQRNGWPVSIAIVDDGGHLLCLLEGGVPAIADQQVLGAVGVSGVNSAEDAQVARAACMAVMPVREAL